MSERLYNLVTRRDKTKTEKLTSNAIIGKPLGKLEASDIQAQGLVGNLINKWEKSGRLLKTSLWRTVQGKDYLDSPFVQHDWKEREFDGMAGSIAKAILLPDSLKEVFPDKKMGFTINYEGIDLSDEAKSKFYKVERDAEDQQIERTEEMGHEMAGIMSDKMLKAADAEAKSDDFWFDESASVKERAGDHLGTKLYVRFGADDMRFSLEKIVGQGRAVVGDLKKQIRKIGKKIRHGGKPDPVDLAKRQKMRKALEKATIQTGKFAIKLGQIKALQGEESSVLDSMSEMELMSRGFIRVKGYIRSDGTKVKTHYRQI